MKRDVKDDPDCYRRITIGKSSFDRYSQRAIDRLRDNLASLDMDRMWADCQAGLRRRARA